eukprot:7799252-Ditylum_brightwellii.AAC.1
MQWSIEDPKSGPCQQSKAAAESIPYIMMMMLLPKMSVPEEALQKMCSKQRNKKTYTKTAVKEDELSKEREKLVKEHEDYTSKIYDENQVDELNSKQLQEQTIKELCKKKTNIELQNKPKNTMIIKPTIAAVLRKSETADTEETTEPKKMKIDLKNEPKIKPEIDQGKTME